MAVTGGVGRRADREFVSGLVEAGLGNLDHLSERIDRLPDTVATEVRDVAWAIVQHLR